MIHAVSNDLTYLQRNIRAVARRRCRRADEGSECAVMMGASSRASARRFACARTTLAMLRPCWNANMSGDPKPGLGRNVRDLAPLAHLAAVMRRPFGEARVAGETMPADDANPPCRLPDCARPKGRARAPPTAQFSNRGGLASLFAHERVFMPHASRARMANDAAKAPTRRSSAH